MLEILLIYSFNTFFCSEVKFPSYDTCSSILSDEVWLLSEYGESNHELMKEMYDNGFVDKDLIRSNGKAILALGGKDALWANAYGLNRIMRHLAATSMQTFLNTYHVSDPTRESDRGYYLSMVLCSINKTHLEPVWEAL